MPPVDDLVASLVVAVVPTSLRTSAQFRYPGPSSQKQHSLDR